MARRMRAGIRHTPMRRPLQRVVSSNWNRGPNLFRRVGDQHCDPKLPHSVGRVEVDATR